MRYVDSFDAGFLESELFVESQFKCSFTGRIKYSGSQKFAESLRGFKANFDVAGASGSKHS
ncbi:hypothetical protein VC83_06773 [Pseudogymnoascus destructans]|nr:uncharacterized protein VC83_06773 [Pseudogymnoascus destructans]OAF56479.1 hypothetical protein VC83_06773 [Pseudogymnoascus destructans]